ncbi:MAG TPA: Rieske 2Fe-2S domain-containing protein, partial [Nocardioidaceae bacterium]|nr:Rieske 2Fe-2S domain-containing protein [Nocardioidaceae bacterium]
MSRRVLIRGAALTGVAAPVLAACGSEDDTNGNGQTAGSPDGAESPESPDEGQGGDTTVATSDVPVGGGTILAEEMVVVTQPSEGEFKAFSAVCTHQGCPVQSISD